MSFVRVGRWEIVLATVEEVFFVSGAGGWLRGRLDTELTTRGLSWAEAASKKPKTVNATQTDRKRYLFKLFKTYYSRIL